MLTQGKTILLSIAARNNRKEDMAAVPGSDKTMIMTQLETNHEQLAKLGAVSRMVQTAEYIKQKKGRRTWPEW